MRFVYTRQLTELAHLLAQMAGSSGVAMREATRALLDADMAAADAACAEHATLTVLSAEAQERALALLALQSPVAGDLRQIVSGIHIVGDIERMGALAVHVTKIARRRHPLPVLPVEVEEHFAEMGRIAAALGASVEEILDTRDPQRAARLDDEDEAMDDLRRELFAVVLAPQWSHGVEAAVDVTLLGRFYERFADHAVAVGHRVVFHSTGTLPLALRRRRRLPEPTLDELVIGSGA